MIELAVHFQNSVGTIVTTLSNAADKLTAATLTLTDISAKANDDAEAVSFRGASATAAIAKVAAEIQTLSKAVTKISNSTDNQARAAEVSRHLARDSEQTMTSLATEAGNAGALVALIRDIAGQTNMLLSMQQ